MNIYLYLLLIILVSSDTYSQSEVKIGKQIWMSKNLDVDRFRNGDPIPHAQTVEEWVNAGANEQPAWCYYNNDTKNGKKYGKLYNYYAVGDSRGLAPQGYHVPSDSEWDILTVFLGSSDIAGKKMKSKNGWKSYEQGNGKKTCPECVDWADSYKEQVPCHTCKNLRYFKIPIVTLSSNGDNSSGFNGLPGGRCNIDGSFSIIAVIGYFWSSSGSNPNFAWSRDLYYGNTKVGRKYELKNNGFSVRCLKD